MPTIFTIFNRSDQETAVFEPGAVIIHKGDEGHEFYAILEGEAEVVHNGIVLQTLKTGEIFGEMSLIDSGPRSADVIAKTSCKLAVVNNSRFLYLVQHNPYFALMVMRVMAERLRLLDERLANI